ncbi:MAG: helix-turn-helix domain-containing protein [Pseudonocardiaceae bacterium]
MRRIRDDLTIAERVRHYRARRGMSQEVLAGLVGRTEDWLSRVENNRIALDRLSVIRRLANALDVTTGALLGEPALLDWSADSGTHTIPALQGVLMDYRQVTPQLAAPSIDNGEPPKLDLLRRDISEVFDAYQDSRYGYVTGRAPLVLSDAMHAARTAARTEQGRVQGLLALAYQCAVAVLTKLGETELAWIASERGLAAAQQADGPLILGSLFRSVTHALHATGHFGAGVELTKAAAGVLQPYLATRADDCLLSIYGSLFLTGAVAASRAEDRQATTTFLTEAQAVANRLGRDANFMWTAFGPTNVAIHRVSTAMELGDVQIALDLGPRVDTSGLPVERRVRHAIEIARAYSARNRRDEALIELLNAEQLAPEQVKYHAISRQLVLSWIRNQRGPRNTRLDHLARRLNLLQ